MSVACPHCGRELPPRVLRQAAAETRRVKDARRREEAAKSGPLSWAHSGDVLTASRAGRLL